jgi:hypothetical protein
MTAVAGDAGRAAGLRADFYTWMFLACLLTAFLGFIPTFWQPLAAGQFKANPVVFFHGVGFFSWTVFALYQASLVPVRNIALHRAVGLAGISFATALVLFGCLAALNSLHTGMAQGQAAGAEAFLIVPIYTIATFAAFVIWAIANIRRPEWHKRAMLLATITVLGAPVARPLIVFVYKFPPTEQLPVWLGVPSSIVGWILVAAGMTWDWRTHGKVHPAWLIGGAVLVLAPVLAIPVADTQMWHNLARAYAALAGVAPKAG